MGIKVLLVYPNYRGMNMLPPAMGLLSAVLKREGHEVDLFDTTYYSEIAGETRADSDSKKADQLMARPVKDARTLTVKHTDVFEDFEKKVQSCSPDLVALSCTEDMWRLGRRLLERLPERDRPRTIVGGVFPTFAPTIVLGHPQVDIVCKGEGEDALATLCDRMERGQPHDDIPNLWIKRPGGAFKINPTAMVDMDANPLIDMSIFEEARFYRPMGGRVWRMLPVETFRGCPYKCAFCNSPSQMAMYREETGGSYLRRKSFENMRRELLFYKEEMGAEYLYMWADTFFSWKRGEFEEFAEMYREIGLPFWCQTRVETITRQNFELLRDIGCARISFGLEHGNEEFRRKYLQRSMTNETIVEKFNIVNEVGIPFSVNNIMGFPHETRELAFDTVRLNRRFECSDRNAYMYTPFSGTPLREECERLGYMKPEDVVMSAVADGSILDMPQFPQSEVRSLTKTFNLYVNFEESRWPEIRRAEADTPEGRAVYERLKKEFVDRFWSRDQAGIEQAAAEL